MIEIRNLVKTFGSKTAVNVSSLAIEDIGIIGLVGNNGAGKTTLFRLILDLLKADSGEVHIYDEDVSAGEEWKKHMGAFIESGFLIDYLTPQEYFSLIGKLSGVSKEDVVAHYERYKNFLPEESDFRGTYIRELSAGNKQKVGIISALLHKPRFILLDEPFNFLDPSSQLVLKRILQNYIAENQASIVISSHNLNHIANFCQRVILMEKGAIIKDLQNTGAEVEATLNEYFVSQLEGTDITPTTEEMTQL